MNQDINLISTLFFPTKHNKYFSNANYANNRKFISITNDRYRGSYKNDFCANLRNLRSKKYLLATQVVLLEKIWSGLLQVIYFLFLRVIRTVSIRIIRFIRVLITLLSQ